MKILQINTVYPYGSTGKIVKQIKETCMTNGIVCYVAYRYSEDKQYPETYTISSWLDCHIHNRLARWTTLIGCFSHIKTLMFIKLIKKYNPDIIHLHNIHGNFINLPMLFKYIKEQHIKVIWTLHDCWAFTGRCPYFTAAKCNGWKDGCIKCPQYRDVPSLILNSTSLMWRLKKKWFTGVENLTIITPSQWLADLVKQSFLKGYPVSVINNGIDLDVFKPIESSFRTKYNLCNKYIILGVAFDWGKRKGLDVFIELANSLDTRFQIVLVGTTNEVDKLLPKSIISIHRTHNQQELVEIYTTADLFVNPTREENYPTVNMEAIACGTPVLTFRTGGSPEIPDEKTGYIVDVDDIDEIKKQILRICTEKPFSKEDCLERAKNFDKKLKFQEYIELYNCRRSYE